MSGPCDEPLGYSFVCCVNDVLAEREVSGQTAFNFLSKIIPRGLIMSLLNLSLSIASLLFL